MKYVHISVLPVIYFICVTCGFERFAFYEEAQTFNGLSRDVKDVRKGRCAARFVSQIMRLCQGLTSRLKFLKFWPK